MTNPFFSLIIPCHNTKPAFMQRLFASLSRQGMHKDGLQVIIVDDNSDDKRYLDYLPDTGFNIQIISTDPDAIHCPGNARRAGMAHVIGEYLCFCDHDDYFEDNALLMVKAHILKQNHTVNCLVTKIHSYDEENQQYISDLSDQTVWLHGKFYNYQKFIKPYNINFKEDLTTNEDAYFNCCVIDKLIDLNEDFDIADIFTYRWVDNPESLSCRAADESSRGYLYDSFADYITATTEPYWENAVATKNPERMNQIIMTLLHCYFYYEYASYTCGAANYADILAMIADLINRIMASFGCTVYDILEFVYSDPQKYHKVYTDSLITCGYYIPKTSFRDFLVNLTTEL